MPLVVSAYILYAELLTVEDHCYSEIHGALSRESQGSTQTTRESIDPRQPDTYTSILRRMRRTHPS